MGKKKRNLIYICLFAVLFAILTFQNFGLGDLKAAPTKQELVFLSWSDYIDPELITEFEEKFNVKVKQLYFETDQLKDEMLLESDGKGYDVVLGSGISLIPYLKKGWISPLSQTEIPNRKHIDGKWLDAHPEIAGYAVPYLWGFIGIAYRKDLVKQKLDSWKQLYQPAEYLRGKIMMINDSRDTICPALKALGYSLNSKDKNHYTEVERLLLSQKPFVKKYGYLALTEESALVTGEAWMSPIYNGDALVLQEIQLEIELAVPREGVNLWIDYLVVMKSSKRKKLACQFINFLNEPKNAARLAEYCMFASPNKTAESLLPPEHLSNKMIYPEKSVLEKSEIARPLPPRISRKRNAIFAKITS